MYFIIFHNQNLDVEIMVVFWLIFLRVLQISKENFEYFICKKKKSPTKFKFH